MILTPKSYNFTSYSGVYLQGTYASTNTPALSATRMKHTMNMKAYEQSNHLGNVLVTVSDARQVLNSGATVTGYMAIVKSANDYSSFGVTKAGRTHTSASYRYGMNGQEKDGEIAEGIYTTEFRGVDVRLGRWLSVDPIVKFWESPYAGFSNNPILYNDPSGLDPTLPADKTVTSTSTSYSWEGSDKDANGNVVQDRVKFVETVTQTTYHFTYDQETGEIERTSTTHILTRTVMLTRTDGEGATSWSEEELGKSATTTMETCVFSDNGKNMKPSSESQGGLFTQAYATPDNKSLDPMTSPYGWKSTGKATFDVNYDLTASIVRQNDGGWNPFMLSGVTIPTYKNLMKTEKMGQTLFTIDTDVIAAVRTVNTIAGSISTLGGIGAAAKGMSGLGANTRIALGGAGFVLSLLNQWMLMERGDGGFQEQGVPATIFQSTWGH